MERLPTSLILLLIFCSLSAGKTFWTHLGTRCIEDCKAYWGAYMCKTIDKDGQCKTIYCSPQENKDYWGMPCSENSKCGMLGNDFHSSKINFLDWGYCGLVTDHMNHYSSYYGQLCNDDCREGRYYWCHTAKGWDYCSPSINTDYKNKQCKADSRCGKYGYRYNWCYVEGGSWGYCGFVTSQMFIPLI